MPRIARLCAYAATLTVIAGCTMGELWADGGDLIDLRPADVTGTWHSGPGQEITFNADGTFTATDLPREAFPPVDLPGQQLDGSGTWLLEPSVVALTYRRLGGAEARRSGPDLDARREDDVTRLYFFYVGDGGNSWTAYSR